MELFQPFIIKSLIKLKLTNSIRESKRKLLEKSQINNKLIIRILNKLRIKP